MALRSPKPPPSTPVLLAQILDRLDTQIEQAANTEQARVQRAADQRRHETQRDADQRREMDELRKTIKAVETSQLLVVERVDAVLGALQLRVATEAAHAAAEAVALQHATQPSIPAVARADPSGSIAIESTMPARQPTGQASAPIPILPPAHVGPPLDPNAEFQAALPFLRRLGARLWSWCGGTIGAVLHRAVLALVAAALAAALALSRWCDPLAPARLRDREHGGISAPPAVEVADAQRPTVVDMLPPAEPEKPRKPKKPPPRPVPDPDGDVTTDPQAGHHRGTMSRAAECRDTPTPRADCAPVPRGAQR